MGVCSQKKFVHKPFVFCEPYASLVSVPNKKKNNKSEYNNLLSSIDRIMSAPTIVEVLNKMKEYVETPVEKQPHICPLNEQERKVFEEHYHTLLDQCPAFANHKCPFDHVHSMNEIHEKIKHINHEEVKKCPAFDDKHGELMKVLKKDIEED